MKAIQLAKSNKVAVGAHPSYPDRKNFGRKSMHMETAPLLEALDVQIQLFFELCHEAELHVHHIKPHGALYNDMARDKTLSQTILTHWKEKYADIIVYVLAESKAHEIGKDIGLSVRGEVFIDRGYINKSKLISRSEPGAMISEESIMQRKLDGFINATILDSNNLLHSARIDTICLHGDHANAAKTAQYVHQYMTENEVHITACR